MRLETERLIIRSWELSDAESLYEYARDDRVGPAAGWNPHKSLEETRQILEKELMIDENYAVCLKEDNRAIGNIELMIGGESPLKLPETEGEIGYWIGVPYWGRGLIPEATGEILRHAFMDLNLQVVWCGHFDGNIKSRRVQEKCGFTYSYTRENFLWELTKEIKTEHVMKITRDEWIKLNEA